MKKNNKEYVSAYTPKNAPMVKRAAAYFIDLILFILLMIGLVSLLSWIFNYQEIINQLHQKYIEHGVYVLNSKNVYEFCDTSSSVCENAWASFNEDPDACALYDKTIQYPTLLLTIAAFFSLLITEFVMPMIFKNGRTLGMKLLGIALADKSGIKVNNKQIFIRFLFGKYMLCTLLPIYGLIMMYFGIIYFMGLIMALGTLIVDISMLFTSPQKSGIANSISSTYAIDFNDTYLFDTIEELNAAKGEEAKYREREDKYF